MRLSLVLAGVGLFILPTTASATFSIVACDESRACGAAVATNNLAVGASVVYAQAGVWAIATQFEMNPGYGAKGLALAQGQRRTVRPPLPGLLTNPRPISNYNIKLS